MPSCMIAGCKNHSSNYKGAFFKMPVIDKFPELAQKWTIHAKANIKSLFDKALSEVASGNVSSNILSDKRLSVCELHFAKDSINDNQLMFNLTNYRSRKSLVPGAYPSLHFGVEEKLTKKQKVNGKVITPRPKKVSKVRNACSKPFVRGNGLTKAHPEPLPNENDREKTIENPLYKSCRNYERSSKRRKENEGSIVETKLTEGETRLSIVNKKDLKPLQVFRNTHRIDGENGPTDAYFEENGQERIKGNLDELLRRPSPEPPILPTPLWEINQMTPNDAMFPIAIKKEPEEELNVSSPDLESLPVPTATLGQIIKEEPDESLTEQNEMDSSIGETQTGLGRISRGYVDPALAGVNGSESNLGLKPPDEAKAKKYSNPEDQNECSVEPLENIIRDFLEYQSRHLSTLDWYFKIESRENGTINLASFTKHFESATFIRVTISSQLRISVFASGKELPQNHDLLKKENWPSRVTDLEELMKLLDELNSWKVCAGFKNERFSLFKDTFLQNARFDQQTRSFASNKCQLIIKSSRTGICIQCRMTKIVLKRPKTESYVIKRTHRYSNTDLMTKKVQGMKLKNEALKREVKTLRDKVQRLITVIGKPDQEHDSDHKH